MTARNSRWRWALLPVGILALAFAYARDGAPYIANDGYQYLDAASNLAHGSCFCTRVALFDEQVAFGHFPVPFTHFAPGYPLLIAALSQTGISGETAGYLLAALGFLAVLWLLLDIALALGARPWIAAAFGLIWVTHATALLYGSAVGTETLFTALLLALVDLIVRDTGSNSRNPVLLTGIGVVAGLSYWVRYPGLFLVGGAGIYLIARAWTARARRGALTGLFAAAVLAGSIQVRNAVYTGSWRGAFKGGGHAARTVVVESMRAFAHLVTGDRVPLRLDMWTGLFLFSALLVALVGIRAAIFSNPVTIFSNPVTMVSSSLESGRNSRMQSVFEPVGWTLFIGLAYIGGVMLASLITIANDLPRYYFPVYPLLLACAAVVFSKLAGGWKSLVVALFVLSVITMEGRSVFVRPDAPDWILTRSMLAEEVQPGTSLLQWLRTRVSPNDTILAVEGQAVHYVVDRPVVAVIFAGFTSHPLDEQGFRLLMKQFRSRYLVLFPQGPADRIPEQGSYGLLRSLVAGNAPPWLKLAARTPDAAVYECAACAD